MEEIRNLKDNSFNRTTLKFKGVTIDLRKCTVIKRGEKISLSTKEMVLLKFFLSHPDQVFSKNQLFDHVWDSSYLEDNNTVLVHIRKLRQKIETDPSNPKFIRTVWGVGYKFTGE